MKSSIVINKSFLKWAGGKTQLLPKLIELGIYGGRRYVEPFVGSGVVALNMPHEKIIIADTNPGVIALWNQIKNNKEFIADAAHYFNERYNNNEEMYYIIRDEFNHSTTNYFLAAAFLYLNKHCFNGLCRFNSKGEFNVPYGHYKVNPKFPLNELEVAAYMTQRMEIRECSFTDTFALIKKHDMVYCDPPYVPLSATSSFTKYSTGSFNNNDHERLVVEAMVAQNKGATVIISNNDTPYTRQLYKDATDIHFIDVRKSISCKSTGRAKQREIIAVYRPKY